MSGQLISSQLIICAAGLGNEQFLRMLDVVEPKSQRRPIRQVMVKPMPFELFGHAIGKSYRPLITVSSYPLASRDYVWYLGGGLVDYMATLSNEESIHRARRELARLFPYIDWSDKFWATWFGVRAEAHTLNGRLPEGPAIQEYGNVLLVWPTKLTLVPLLGDQVRSILSTRGLRPHDSKLARGLDCLSTPPRALVPWMEAKWAFYS